MKKRNNHLSTILTTSLLGLLAACGGGGSSDSSSTSSSSSSSSSSSGGASTTGYSTSATDGTSGVQTGHYVDYVVSGLRYVTATKSGVTDAAGSYQFLPGETVQFYLYDTALSPSTAALVLTPADTANANIDYTINLLRFLQAIDTDANPDNGIVIPTVASGETWNFDFTLPLEDFEKDATVQAFLTKYAAGRSLPTLASMTDHFNASIAGLNDTYSFPLKGKTAVGYVTNNICKDPTKHYGAQASTFTDDSFRIAGVYMTWDTNVHDLGTADCADDGGSYDKTFTYASQPTSTFACGPTCTYKGLNRMIMKPVDSAGRKSIVLMWNTPGTNQVVYIKRYLPDASATTVAGKKDHFTYSQFFTVN